MLSHLWRSHLVPFALTHGAGCNLLYFQKKSARCFIQTSLYCKQFYKRNLTAPFAACPPEQYHMLWQQVSAECPARCGSFRNAVEFGSPVCAIMSFWQQVDFCCVWNCTLACMPTCMLTFPQPEQEPSGAHDTWKSGFTSTTLAAACKASNAAPCLVVLSAASRQGPG